MAQSIPIEMNGATRWVAELLSRSRSDKTPGIAGRPVKPPAWSRSAHFELGGQALFITFSYKAFLNLDRVKKVVPGVLRNSVRAQLLERPGDWLPRSTRSNESGQAVAIRTSTVL